MIDYVREKVIILNAKIFKIGSLIRRHPANCVEPAFRRQPAQFGEFDGGQRDVDAEAIVTENLRQGTAQARYRRSNLTVQQVHAFPSGISLIPSSYANIDAPAN